MPLAPGFHRIIYKTSNVVILAHGHDPQVFASGLPFQL